MALSTEPQAVPQPRQVLAALPQLLKRLLLAGATFTSLVVVVLLAFKLKGLYDFHYGFDRQRWIAVGIRKTGEERDNPRQHMVDDVMAHHLRLGMTRAEVLALLGPADFDGVQMLVPDTVKLPATVSSGDINSLNAWFISHAQPDTVMRYYVGWDIIDPLSLRARFSGKRQVNQLRVVNH